MGSGLKILARRKDGTEFPADVALDTLVVGGDTFVTCTVRDITERSRVEEAVRRSERLIHCTMDSLSAHIAILDGEGNILAVNAPWRRFAEKHRLAWADHGVGHNYLQVCDRAHGLQAAIEVAAGIRELLSERRNEFRVEYDCHSTQGKRWFSAQGTPLREDGLVGLVIAHEDITERRQSEEETRLLHTIVLAVGESESLPEALGVVARKVCEVTGWVCGEAWVPNASGAFLEHGPSWSAPGAGLEEFRKASEAYRFPKGLGLPGRVWQEGEPAWLPEISSDERFLRRALAHRVGIRAAAAIPVVAGRDVIAVLLFFHVESRQEDRRLVALASAIAAQLGTVIQRKRAEDALRRSQELLQQIIDSSEVVIYVKDTQGRFLHINRRFEELFHVGRDSFKGKTDHDLFSREIADTFRKNDEEVLRTCSIHTWEEVVTQDDGLHTYLSVKFPLRDASGAPYAVCGISTDITERKRTEEELRRAKTAAEAASLAKSLFVANMSHEMRTPLNAVIALTDLLLETDLEPEQRESLVVVKGSGVFLLSLISDVLDFSSIQAGGFVVCAAPFDLRRSLESALQPQVLKAAQKKIELDWRLPTEAPECVIGDERRFIQVLTNLVDNAIKFTEAGSVQVEAKVQSRAGDELVLEISVKDTGIGIAPDKRELIFQEFTQADASPTRKYGGIGLGLTLLARLLELMGGRIWFESEEGKGSTFHFAIPFKLPAARKTQN